VEGGSRLPRIGVSLVRAEPCLRTKNAHTGRQVWELDAGTDTDTSVDAAHQAFIHRRHQLKHSADLPMRILCNLKNF